MKRAFGLIILAIGIMAGCTVKESAEFTEAHLVFTASRESVTPDTKSVKLEDGTVWWGPQEEISMFYGSGTAGGSKFTSTNTSHAETVEFEGNITISGSKEFWAVYPYSADNSCDGSSITTVIPHQQTGVEGNFSNDAFPAMAKASSMNLPFWNICGGVKFFVSRTDIKSVTIKGNNGETLAGKVKVAFNADGHPEVTEVIDGQSEVTLTAPDGGCFKPLKYYYITLLPTTLDGGITLTFTTDTEIGTLTSDKEQTIKRSIFGVLKNVDSKVSEWESTVVEPTWVDLGLSVKWATFNVGATKPEEYGDYFAWGETEPKDSYIWQTYMWCKGSFKTFTKYCTSNQASYWDGSGSPDNKTILDIEDDAAHANWGGSWRMPTNAEWIELINNCTWAWTDNYNGSGITGRVVTASNGNSIFLPAAGSRNSDFPDDLGAGKYWSSSLCLDKHGIAWHAYFESEVVIRFGYPRDFGQSVRPVYGEFIPVSSITLDKSSLELIVGASAQLTATISPSNATVLSVRWESEDYSIVSVDQNGNISAMAEGSTTITAYASNGLSATCAVTVSKEPQPEAVDLGLSVKWASFNVGANAPEVFGDLFAWGETTPRPASSFTQYWAAYKWCNGSGMSLTKYCYEQNYGQVDNKTVLEPEDDAATVNVGSDWRTPTSTEIDELLNNCSWEYVILNDVPGYRVTSQVYGYTDKSIFLPCPIFDNDLYNDLGCTPGTLGLYWSSSLFPQSNQHSSVAYCLAFIPSEALWDCLNRFAGFPVRPVYGKLIPVSSITLDKSSLKLPVGNTIKMTATVTPSNASASSVLWVTGDDSIVTVDDSGNLTALEEGTTTITAYSSNGLSATCAVTVSKEPQPEAVDLGLSVKWASFNVGATKPEEYGDYFAWGETEPKEDYSWATYKYANGSYNKLTKYCPKDKTDYWDGIGEPDGLTQLELEDDAARVIWGDSWRMPTYDDFTEILSSCTWVWTTENGTNGYRVTSNKAGYTDKSIFLPAAGYHSEGDSNMISAEYISDYWSSSLVIGRPGFAHFLNGAPDNIYRPENCFFVGMPIRPVCPKD